MSSLRVMSKVITTFIEIQNVKLYCMMECGRSVSKFLLIFWPHNIEGTFCARILI